MTEPRFAPADVARLVGAAATVAGAAELTGTLEAIVRTAMDLTGARYGALGVLGAHGFVTEFIHMGMDSDTVERIGAPPAGHGLLGTITRVGGGVRAENIAEHPDSVGFPEHHPPMRTFLGVPIRVADAVFGNLYLTEKDEGFGDEDMALVEALATIGGSAIATARMSRRLRTVAIVEDRERIARDLHDAIIQDIFAVGLGLQVAANRVVDPVVGEELRDAATRLDEAITSLRRFIFDLRPPVWAQRRVRDELADLVYSLAEPHEADVEVLFRGEVDDLPDRLVDEILPIVRESLSNALRHADASHVSVMINRRSELVIVRTIDDGRGFSVDTSSGGMGLQNLRTRAADLSGYTEITSAPGEGTTVEVSLPL
ncbi:MAG: GAF domain-containing sensor histidine kinase [Acidimicrobiia bacterium]|nr:GAF domain-containing sensor histidine kinase [Acidimicrobiia bacterium]